MKPNVRRFEATIVGDFCFAAGFCVEFNSFILGGILGGNLGEPPKFISVLYFGCGSPAVFLTLYHAIAEYILHRDLPCNLHRVSQIILAFPAQRVTP